MTDAPLFAFDNSYARLPDRFYARQPPETAPAPAMLRVNAPLAEFLGIDPARLASAEGAAALAGGRLPDGAEPLAMAYAGHQFGGWVPQLGDGRAILLGEVVAADGQRRDIHLKGAGRTPFSRMGDGRAAIGPVLREFIVSEAMHALGAPTTRALAALSTGETVLRERPLPGALLVRVARSHVRVGTFQFFTARGDVAGVRALADYVIARHYPDAAEAAEPYRALLDAVVGAQARLIAVWMGVGFIHGVMNTDNMQVAGETIDYGPCAFMDRYRADQVYSSIDQHGRYAYSNQPRIAHWNLANFAQCLLPLLAPDGDAAVEIAQASVDAFPARYAEAWLAGFGAKIGLSEPAEEDRALAADFLDAMETGGADFTLAFRRLADCAADPGADAALAGLFSDPAPLSAWLARWRERLDRETDSAMVRRAAMRAVNPAAIPRNHRVEAALRAAEVGDLGPFDALREALARPYEDPLPGDPDLAPPLPGEEIAATFCGT